MIGLYYRFMVVYQCEFCGEPITHGEMYYELPDGKKCCECCIKYKLAELKSDFSDDNEF